MANNYLTATQLRDFRPPGTTEALDFTGWTDAQLDIIISNVEELFEACLGDFFYRKDDITVFADGNNHDKLFIAQNADFPHKIILIDSVDEVSFDRTTVRTAYVQGTDYRAEEYFLQANNEARISGRAIATGNIGVWPIGDKNIRIIGSFGWDPTPVNITKAVAWYSVIESLGEEDAGLSGSFGEGGATEEEWEDYRRKIGSNTALTESKRKGLPYITGYADIDILLKPYVNYINMFRTP